MMASSVFRRGFGSSWGITLICERPVDGEDADAHVCKVLEKAGGQVESPG